MTGFLMHQTDIFFIFLRYRSRLKEEKSTAYYLFELRFPRQEYNLFYDGDGDEEFYMNLVTQMQWNHI